MYLAHFLQYCGKAFMDTKQDYKDVVANQFFKENDILFCKEEEWIIARIL